MKVVIYYLVIEHERSLVIDGEPSPAIVWKRQLVLASVPDEEDVTPLWCHDRVLEAYPSLDAYTVAIVGIDIE